MLAGLRTYAQSLANGLMETPVSIRHRNAIAKDPSNASGDDVPTWGSTISAVGWFVDPSTATFADTGGMTAVVDRPTLRLPVGTQVESRDQVTINGNVWVVIDVSDDETWPAMLKVSLVREA